MAVYNTERRWQVPNKRAKSFAEERKAGLHMHGQKEGKQLTDFEAGVRAGYLLDQNDQAGLYRYKQALNAGLSKQEAKKFSKQKGTKLEEITNRGGKK